MTDTESLVLLSPMFEKAKEVLSQGRGDRGTLWTRLPIEDLIALLHVKSERLRTSPKADDALDAINYAAMILQRLIENEWIAGYRESPKYK